MFESTRRIRGITLREICNNLFNLVSQRTAIIITYRRPSIGDRLLHYAALQLLLQDANHFPVSKMSPIPHVLPDLGAVGRQGETGHGVDHSEPHSLSIFFGSGGPLEIFTNLVWSGGKQCD